jgi:hypothetical protein
MFGGGDLDAGHKVLDEFGSHREPNQHHDEGGRNAKPLGVLGKLRSNQLGFIGLVVLGCLDVALRLRRNIQADTSRLGTQSRTTEPTPD